MKTNINWVIAYLLFSFPIWVVADKSHLEEAQDKEKVGYQYQTIKLKPPVSIEYQVIGQAQIGQPLQISIIASSAVTDSPVRLRYQSVNADSLSLMPGQDGQQSFQLSANTDNTRMVGTRTILVVPQQEGRSFINVVAEIDTPDGIMTTSQAIAIQVGNQRPEKKINGTLSTDQNGEGIISMPAN